MPRRALDVSWARVGVAMAAAWTFFFATLAVRLLYAAPGSTLYALLEFATPVGFSVLFAVVLFAPPHRYKADAALRDPLR